MRDAVTKLLAKELIPLRRKRGQRGQVVPPDELRPVDMGRGAEGLFVRDAALSVMSSAFPGQVTLTGWAPPSDLSEADWITAGEYLSVIGTGYGWWVGDWWMHAPMPHRRAKEIVTAPDWKGLSYKTCIAYAKCCRSIPKSRRIDLVPFTQHREVCTLPPIEADSLLAWCGELIPSTGEPRTVHELRSRVKHIKRTDREGELAGAIELASEHVGHQLYGVIYADPPWRFEPYSRDTGMDRAADNHYPTMDADAIADLTIPAAEDCVLFLWATVPMLEDALSLIKQWGFEYKSHQVWVKDRIGTGYWFRNKHELLLVATRGTPPAPAPGTQWESVVQAPLAKHSVKPEAFAEMITSLFPTVPKLEMFARRQRAGWDSWGAEAETPVSNR
jgi:N6-adenosine-specific RNA methylase IME4